MKIFHPLLCYYPSQAGGPANTLYWLNSALSKKKFQPNILSTFYGIENEGRVKFEYGPSHKVNFIDSKGKFFIIKGFENIKDCDIIQFSSLFFLPTLPLLIAALWQHKKIIISPRGELYDSALAIKSLKKIIWLRIIKVFQRSIFFHATNEYEKAMIRKKFPLAVHIQVIPNFIKLPEKLSIVVDTNQILFIGRINPIKNIDILIEALADVNNKYSKKLKLVIAGNAVLDYEIDYFQKLRGLIKRLKIENNVEFLGHITGEKKQALLASSYALVLPSKSENFGNVVLEAMAQGTPVVASKNAPWEILRVKKAGYWIEPTLEVLTNTLNKITNLDSNLYHQMCHNAYEVCRNEFDIDHNIYKWEDFYNQIRNKK
jgi:glycosyltransferase involved in cell wall biosynthesis